MSAPQAVFLDRDGTLIEDVGYPRDPDRVRLLPGVPEALQRLRQAGFRLVIVSNQSGVGRGLVTPEEVTAVHRRLIEVLEGHGVVIDDARYCPHAPEDACDCRKPSPAMLYAAAEHLGIDLAGSFMVGDKASDAEAGRRAGAATVLLSADAGGGEAGADHLARDLPQAVELILAAVPA